MDPQDLKLDDHICIDITDEKIEPGHRIFAIVQGVSHHPRNRVNLLFNPLLFVLGFNLFDDPKIVFNRHWLMGCAIYSDGKSVAMFENVMGNEQFDLNVEISRVQKGD